MVSFNTGLDYQKIYKDNVKQYLEELNNSLFQEGGGGGIETIMHHGR